MVIVSVNEARKHLADLINSVAQGGQVAISRRGKPIARLSAIRMQEHPRLPDLAEFRKSLGEPPRKPMATIARLREQERY
jgi:prevent-host-death family protein